MVIGKAQASLARLIGRRVERILPRAPGLSSPLLRPIARERAAIDPGIRVLAAARELRAAVTDSAYAHTPQIEPDRGFFRGDCSDLINFLLEKVDAAGLAAVPVDAVTKAPRSRTYFSFFKDLPAISEFSAGQKWSRVPRPADFRPGDIIAWKNAAYLPGKGSTGHMMLVSGPPVPVVREGRIAGFDVPIIDSTSHGHGVADPRLKGKLTGLGEGIVYFPVDEKGLASAFSWNPSGEVNAGPLRPPDLAVGRLHP
jgi:hypothetical protein